MRSKIRLRRVPLDEVPWDELDRRPDRTVYQTRAWLEFLTATQAAEPVVAQVLDGAQPLGWFTGAVVRRSGIRMLGSPLPGWTTSYMGFNLDLSDDLSNGRSGLGMELLESLGEFAFGPLRCLHLELMDRHLSLPEGGGLPGRALRSGFHSYQLDLTDDESMLAGMSQNARRNIRRSVARSVEIEEVTEQDGAEFAADYYSQVCQSFAKRDLVPTYSLERVEALVEMLHPAGRLLLLRARTSDGEVAATGIFPGLPGSYATFWMGASEPRHLDVRPNEAVMWHAIKAWRDRGALAFDFGGGGDHKAKYGGRPIEVDWVRWSRFPGMDQLRSGVARSFGLAQRLRGRGAASGQR